MPKGTAKRAVLEAGSPYAWPEFQQLVAQMVQQAMDERDNTTSNPIGGIRHESLPQVGGSVSDGVLSRVVGRDFGQVQQGQVVTHVAASPNVLEPVRQASDCTVMAQPEPTPGPSGMQHVPHYVEWMVADLPTPPTLTRRPTGTGTLHPHVALVAGNPSSLSANRVSDGQPGMTRDRGGSGG